MILTDLGYYLTILNTILFYVMLLRDFNVSFTVIQYARISTDNVKYKRTKYVEIFIFWVTNSLNFET